MKNLSFEYKGYMFKISVVPSGEEHIRRAKERIKECFAEYADRLGLIHPRAGDPVKWEAYIDSDGREKADMEKFLEALGRLSYERRNNWEIISDLASLNPRSGSGFLFFFSRRADACEYARKAYGNAQYPWVIARYAEVLSRNQVMNSQPSAT